MQALFFRFFEKKLFLTHYERQKNLKKFPFFRFFLLSPPRFRLFSPFSGAKTHAKTRLKTAWKRKNGGAERFPRRSALPLFKSSSFRLIFRRQIRFTPFHPVSPRFASFRLNPPRPRASCGTPHGPAFRQAQIPLVRPGPRPAGNKKKAGSGSMLSRPAGQAGFELTCRTPGSCRA